MSSGRVTEVQNLNFNGNSLILINFILILVV